MLSLSIRETPVFDVCYIVTAAFTFSFGCYGHTILIGTLAK